MPVRLLPWQLAPWQLATLLRLWLRRAALATNRPFLYDGVLCEFDKVI